MPLASIKRKQFPGLPAPVQEALGTRRCRRCHCPVHRAKAACARFWSPPADAPPNEIGARPRVLLTLQCPCGGNGLVEIDLALDEARELLDHIYCYHARQMSRPRGEGVR